MNAVTLLLLANLQTFQFAYQNQAVEGYLIMPEGKPKAVVLYFHRAIEDRNAVKDWSSQLGPKGYAVAGYTSTGSKDVVAEARAATESLRRNKGIASLPVYAAGGSMGCKAAAGLFAAEPQIRGLIVVVPGGDQICDAMAKSGTRPILLIQAEQDEVVDPEAAKEIKACLPKTGTFHLLNGASHRFPVSAIAPQILDWLAHQGLKK
jgi:dienelactone hydrolase